MIFECQRVVEADLVAIKKRVRVVEADLVAMKKRARVVEADLVAMKKRARVVEADLVAMKKLIENHKKDSMRIRVVEGADPFLLSHILLIRIKAQAKAKAMFQATKSNKPKC